MLNIYMRNRHPFYRGEAADLGFTSPRFWKRVSITVAILDMTPSTSAKRGLLLHGYLEPLRPDYR